MKDEILKDLALLYDLVNDTIDKLKKDEDINEHLRKIAVLQMMICAEHFEYEFDINSKKIKEILEDEEKEDI